MFFWLRKAAKPVQAGAPADRAGDVLTSRCRELGVEAALSEITGISPPMLVALGENGIKTVEDLAGCDTDELHGWVEQTSATTTRHAGVLDGFALSRRPFHFGLPAKQMNRPLEAPPSRPALSVRLERIIGTIVTANEDQPDDPSMAVSDTDLPG